MILWIPLKIQEPLAAEQEEREIRELSLRLPAPLDREDRVSVSEFSRWSVP